MKTGRKRCLHLFLAACVLWGMVGVLPAAAAGEAVSIEGVRISFVGDFIFEYQREPIKPQVIVDFWGIPLYENIDYTISYENNVDAGIGTVVVHGKGKYKGKEKIEFEIKKKKIPVSLPLVCTKNYDGKCTAQPKITGVPIQGDDITILYENAEYCDEFAGTQKEVTISGISVGGPDGHNYTVENPNLSKNIGHITENSPPQTVEVEFAKGQERHLKEAIPEPWGETATFEVDSSNEKTMKEKGCTLSDGVLKAGNERTSFTIDASVKEVDVNGDGNPEYGGNTYVAIKVKVVDKESQNPTEPDVTDPEDPNNKGDGGDPEDPPPPHTTEDQGNFSIDCPRTMTYGETVRLKTTGGKGNGEVTFSIKERGDWGWATIDQQGMLTATQAGKVLVCAEKAGDDRYKPVKANPIEVTIQPATVIIQVKNKTAKVGDPAPVLGHTDYTIKGLVAGDQMVSLPTLYYAPDPDMTQEGRTSILASGAVVPAGGNYHSQVTCFSGTLVVEKGKDPDEEKKPEPTPEPDLIHAITIRQTENGTVTADCRKARAGEDVLLTTTPAQGYVLEKLTVRSQGKTLALWQEENGRHTFTMPDQEVTVSAVFAEKPKEPEKPVEPQEPEPPKELPFLDVGGVDWYYEDVNYVYRQGLMDGTRSFTFSPHNLCTRGMLVTILYRMEGSPEGAKWSPFQDVPAEAYYSAAVSWAAWNGIASGYDAAHFGPDDPISREQLATILYRYGTYRKWDLPGSGDLSWFLDWKESHAYARQALSWAVEEGLLKGMGQGVLDPGGPATRAQLAALLHRFHAQYLDA